ncbi:MAG: hypothetical protein HPM95_02825 [Alphaproteobacteria bacterium]|nr:hypothetical protein [Alphaproteobacteria bacterium]
MLVTRMGDRDRRGWSWRASVPSCSWPSPTIWCSRATARGAFPSCSGRLRSLGLARWDLLPVALCRSCGHSRLALCAAPALDVLLRRRRHCPHAWRRRCPLRKLTFRLCLRHRPSSRSSGWIGFAG